MTHKLSHGARSVKRVSLTLYAISAATIDLPDHAAYICRTDFTKKLRKSRLIVCER